MGVREDTEVIVKETYACDKCESFRGQNNVKMKLSEFNEKQKKDHEEYWKETSNNMVQYRRHVSSSNFRCRSC